MRQRDLFGTPYIKNEPVPYMPYMGSKNKLATKILNAIYQVVGDFDRVYDLFGGGAAFSTAALMAGHNVRYNEKNTSIVELLRHIAAGKKLPDRWITREEYREKVGGDDWFAGFLKSCWSFGNNSEKGYLFGAENEKLKRLGHEVVINKCEVSRAELSAILGVALPMPKSRLDFRRTIMRLTGERGDLPQLQQLQQLQQLEISNLDYAAVEIVPGSVIYCDPPYAGTAEYKEGAFDHAAFWQWCREQRNPVFVSEYSAPDDFKVVAEFEHRSTLSATNNAKVTLERVFWNGRHL